MLKKQLVLSDIDGTLIDSEQKLQPEVITAIRDYSQAGGHFVLASARPALGMVQLARELQIELPLVTLNGALIVQSEPAKPDDFKILLEQPLPDGAALRVYNLINDLNLEVSVNVHAGTHWYVDQPDYWSNQEAEIVNFQPESTNLYNLLTSGTTVHKILCMGDPNEIDKLDALLREESDLNLSASRSKLTYLELTARGVAKSSALEHLADLWHIPLADTMAIGDGENDLPMMFTAGLGVAMGNALPRVRESIKTQVDDNDHAGVAMALRQYAM